MQPNLVLLMPVSVVGLGHSVPQVTPSQILGFDTNTRSGVHEMNGKHTQGVRAMVTPTSVPTQASRFKSAHNQPRLSDRLSYHCALHTT